MGTEFGFILTLIELILRSIHCNSVQTQSIVDREKYQSTERYFSLAIVQKRIVEGFVTRFFWAESWYHASAILACREILGSGAYKTQPLFTVRVMEV